MKDALLMTAGLIATAFVACLVFHVTRKKRRRRQLRERGIIDS